MYKGFKKGDIVYLASQEVPYSENYLVKEFSVWRKGRAYLDVERKGMSIRFRDNEIIGSDIFGRIYYLFKTEKEANGFIKKREIKLEMKDKIMRTISKCDFDELEDIYLYLEKRFPEEMR